MTEIRISPTQIKLWNECKEKHRLSYLLNRESVKPSIHYQFGKAIHKMAENYWNGKDYMQAFHAALMVAQELDPRKLDVKTQAKWTELQESIAPITTIYYGYHGTANQNKPLLNESLVEWEWGTHAGIKIICNGIIDRFDHLGTLIDTKTASAVGANWKADLKKRLLREPQMGFYFRYLIESKKIKITTSCQYEVIVKSYRGSDPKIEIIDVTEEVCEFQQIFYQQMDWTIREIAEFYAKLQDAHPWPMSNTACVNMWGECEFLPVCSGKTDVDDTKLYQIKQPREEVEA